MSEMLNYKLFMSLNIDLMLANSAYPNEMSHKAAFHLVVHCLPKYLSTSIQSQ